MLDSACVSFGSLCIVAGSGGPAWVSCCSSAGFSLCLHLVPCVLLLAVEVLLCELLQECWIQLVSNWVLRVLCLVVEVLLG